MMNNYHPPPQVKQLQPPWRSSQKMRSQHPRIFLGERPAVMRAMVKVVAFLLGMGNLPPFIGILIVGYINPYSTIGKQWELIDPGTCLLVFRCQVPWGTVHSGK